MQNLASSIGFSPIKNPIFKRINISYLRMNWSSTVCCCSARCKCNQVISLNSGLKHRRTIMENDWNLSKRSMISHYNGLLQKKTGLCPNTIQLYFFLVDEDVYKSCDANPFTTHSFECKLFYFFLDYFFKSSSVARSLVQNPWYFSVFESSAYFVIEHRLMF